METFTSKGASVEVGLPTKAKVSQEWPWVFHGTPWMSWKWPWMTREWPWLSRWYGASVGASPLECPEVLKLLMEHHHVSQGGNQGEFRNGGAM